MLLRNGDEDAKKELFRRFSFSAKKLAGKMYDQYRHCSKAEYDDLEAIGLYALCISIEKYLSSGSFFSFWRSVAINEMHEYIKQYSITFPLDLITSEEINSPGYDGDYYFCSSETVSESVWNDYYIDKIIDILNDPKNKFPDNIKKMFLYYLEGYSYQEISDIVGLSYSNVRGHIKKTKDIIANILKYSIE